MYDFTCCNCWRKRRRYARVGVETDSCSDLCVCVGVGVGFVWRWHILLDYQCLCLFYSPHPHLFIWFCQRLCANPLLHVIYSDTLPALASSCELICVHLLFVRVCLSLKIVVSGLGRKAHCSYQHIHPKEIWDGPGALWLCSASCVFTVN